ncbi:MAG: type II secretion system protein [Planctomycetota bacterium]
MYLSQLFKLAISMTNQKRSTRGTHRESGFTLVELLVVIGIIVLLVGILLPSLTRARASASNVKSLSNHRQLVAASLLYATDYDGSKPWGKWSERYTANPPPVSDPAYSLDMVYPVVITHYTSNEMPLFQSLNSPLEGQWADILRCPTVPQELTRTPWDYMAHPVIYPSLQHEVNPSFWSTGVPPEFAIGPAKLTQLFPDNVLFWDMVKYPLSPTTGAGDWTSYSAGPFYGFSGLDRGYLSNPLRPDYRYRLNPDPNEGDPQRGLGYPALIEGPGSPFDPNQDYGAYPIFNTNNGMPRWRQRENTACNFSFADGSARSIDYARNNSHPVETGTGTPRFIATELSRENLRIKFPAGLRLP